MTPQLRRCGFFESAPDILGAMWQLHARFLAHVAAGAARWPADGEQIAALQEKQVRRLLGYAYDETAFYRRIFDESGFHPRDFRSLDDLSRIPIHDRDARQSTPPEDLISRHARIERMTQNRTSGSSGKPLSVYRTEPELLLYRFLHWLMYHSLGNRPRDRRATVAIIRHHSARLDRNPLSRMGWYPMEIIDILLPAEEILARLRQARPDILIAPSSAAVWLAREMSEADGRVIRPRLVLTWGETVPEESRPDIARLFGAEAVDFYGSHESRMIAVSCRKTGLYHLFEAITLAEVLRDGRPAVDGEEGEVVVTALWTYGMPFVRYRQGDLVVMGPERCPCGAPCRTLRSIEGRKMDRIVLPDGSTMHPYAVIGPVVQGTPWVKRYQFQRQEERLLRLLLEAHGSPGADQIAAVERAVQAKLGAQVAVRTEVVDTIPLPPTGKYYPYVSQERLEGWRSAADHPA